MKFISAVLVLALSFGADAFISPRLANVARAKALRSAVAEAPAASGMTNAEAQAVQDAAVAKAIEGATLSHKANMEELAAGGKPAAPAEEPEAMDLNLEEMFDLFEAADEEVSSEASGMPPAMAALDDKEKLKATGFKSGYKI